MTTKHTRINDDPYDLLEVAGRALYDEDWSTPLARSLGVNPDTMRKWRRRKIALPLDHDVLRRALNLLQRRAVTTNKAARLIGKVIPQQ
jgi:transposase-like protein